VPGHSHGHLALYDPLHKTAFVGDAIHGRGCPYAKEAWPFPSPTTTLTFIFPRSGTLSTWPIETLYSGHWPTMRGEEIRDFIAESRQTVELLDRVILASLEKNRPGLTLKELMTLWRMGWAIGRRISSCWPCFPSRGISIGWKSAEKFAPCAGRGRGSGN